MGEVFGFGLNIGFELFVFLSQQVRYALREWCLPLLSPEKFVYWFVVFCNAFQVILFYLFFAFD